MKAILEFNLPDDAWAHRMALRGADLHAVLREVDDYCRNKLKYQSPSKAVQETLEDIRNIIRLAVPDLDDE